jgi:transcriptional regulator with XRE-family HTH domain
VNIGFRLKQVREIKGISGKALAEKVNVVPSQIYKIESGTTNPSIDLLQRICQAVGMSMAEFFSDDETYQKAAADLAKRLVTFYDQAELSPQNKTAAAVYKSLSADEQAGLAMEYIKSAKASSSGIEYRIFDEEDIIAKYKSLPEISRKALASIIDSLAAKH